MKGRILVVGAGGHARSMVDAILAAGVYDFAGFIDPNVDSDYRGYRVIGSDDDLVALRESGIYNAAIGLGFLGGGALARKAAIERAAQAGFHLPVIVDPTAALASDVEIGEGTFIGKNAVVNAGAVIGRCAIINSGAVVEHDCAVGDGSHISVNASLCGGVHAGVDVFVGAGAVVIQGVTLGERCIVGANSTVLDDVAARTTVVGVFNGG